MNKRGHMLTPENLNYNEKAGLFANHSKMKKTSKGENNKAKKQMRMTKHRKLAKINGQKTSRKRVGANIR